MITESAQKILIVDDEAPICIILSRWLTREGYECKTAGNGREALELLRAEPFDLMLTDINMPVMTGTELLGEVRKEFKDLAVIMVSAVDDRGVALAALEQGAFNYLLKPFEHVEVLIHVANALRLNRLEKEKQLHHHELVELFLERTRALKQAYADLEQHQHALQGAPAPSRLPASAADSLRSPLSFLSNNVDQLQQYFTKLGEFITAQEEVLEALAGYDPMLDTLEEKRDALKIDWILKDSQVLLDECREAIERVRRITAGA